MKTRKNILAAIAAGVAAAILSVPAFADITIENWTDCYGADVTSFASGAETDILTAEYTNSDANLDWTDIGFKIVHTDWSTEVWVDAYSSGTAGEQTFSITLAELLQLAKDKAGTDLGEILWIDVRSYSGDVLTSVKIEAAPAVTAPDDSSAETDAAVGDTAVATEGSSKDNSDTGVEGVAVLAGAALAACGAILICGKKK